MSGEGQAPDMNGFSLDVMEATILYALLYKTLPDLQAGDPCKVVERVADGLRRQEVPCNAERLASLSYQRLLNLRENMRAHLVFAVGDEAIADLEQRASRSSSF